MPAISIKLFDLSISKSFGYSDVKTKLKCVSLPTCMHFKMCLKYMYVRACFQGDMVEPSWNGFNYYSQLFGRGRHVRFL